MTRLQAILALLAAPAAVVAKPSEHAHSWHLSPFYVTVASTYEEPRFYPPGGSVRIETCDCGAMRLPDGLGKLTGENVAMSPEASAGGSR